MSKKEYPKNYINEGYYRPDYAWKTAIGLQAVDGLKTSDYLLDVARKQIEGKIDIAYAGDLIDKYYKESAARDELSRSEEADKVSVRIAAILSERSFSFSPLYFQAINKQLFNGIYKHAGQLRSFNITKPEWVLDGDTVLYGSASVLKETLEYDFEKERAFDYSKLPQDAVIKHIARFISDLWQIHPFEEGNTRTTAVFLIQYLRRLGFDVKNDSFEKNSWYFRNALVRANYSNQQKGITETTVYLEMFLRKLLLDEKNELKNRRLHVNYTTLYPDLKPDDSVVRESIADLGNVSRRHMDKLRDAVKDKEYFARPDVIKATGLSPAEASRLIGMILDRGFIEKVRGYGKGRYRFAEAAGYTAERS